MSEGCFGSVLIQAVGLTKIYGEGVRQVEVFRDLDVTVNSGERIAITGASGVGKSTLLHILGLLDRPTSGRVYYSGMDVMAMSDEKRALFRNSHVGFVFQLHYLLPEFNALENVMMPGIIAGQPRSELRERAIKWLERLGLGDRLSHKIGELSGGEQQRVAIARALVLSPTVLLADEPTGNLDSRTSRIIHKMLVELNENMGLTMVVVTHNMELASMMHRSLRLVDGRLIREK
ncbi:MAG: ABC transporter ATP-binding protein [Syntrophobacterales bacterium]|nr:ABC transporter ATP-binding protein [Syntrophobacterales bacterium]